MEIASNPSVNMGIFVLLDYWKLNEAVEMVLDHLQLLFTSVKNGEYGRESWKFHRPPLPLTFHGHTAHTHLIHVCLNLVPCVHTHAHAHTFTDTITLTTAGRKKICRSETKNPPKWELYSTHLGTGSKSVNCFLGEIHEAS